MQGSTHTANANAGVLPTKEQSLSGEPRPWLWSIAGVILGVIALGLGMIPAFALERPLPNPFAEASREQPRVEPPAEPDAKAAGGLTFTYKKFSVTFGGKNRPDEKHVKTPEVPQEASQKTELRITRDPARWFTLSALSFALVGMVVGAVGHVRERHTLLTSSTFGCCTAALAWPYLAIGIAIGTAVAVGFIVLILLASILSGG